MHWGQIFTYDYPDASDARERKAHEKQCYIPTEEDVVYS